jgi:hypothetical protein
MNENTNMGSLVGAQSTSRPEPTPTLMEGMLLLDPDYHGRAHLWAVVKVNKTSTRLLWSNGRISMDARLRYTTLPKGWEIIDLNELAADLTMMSGVASEDGDQRG